jgi:hypothetical protein
MNKATGTLGIPSQPLLGNTAGEQLNYDPGNTLLATAGEQGWGTQLGNKSTETLAICHWPLLGNTAGEHSWGTNQLGP